MRKVYVNVTTRIIMQMEEGIEVSDVVSDMDYSFVPQTEGIEFLDTEIRDHEVIDSK